MQNSLPIISAYNTNGASTEFGWGARLDSERQKRAALWALLYSERLHQSVESGLPISYSYSDMVVSCTYNAKTCNETNFISFYNPTYGTCQQFNFGGEFISSRAGPLYGLRMVLRTDQADYLPWTETSGVIMVIHTQDEVPYPDVFGYFAPPGTASSLGVNYVSTSRLGKPYGTCTTQKTLTTTHYTGNYTVEACFRSCMQEKIVTECGCYDPAYSHAENSTASCDTYGDPSTNLACIDEINNPDTSVFNIISECNCPQPCNVDSYSVTVSTALWPATGYTPTECGPAANTSKPWLETEDTCISWFFFIL
ncbi:unnamed protein product [Caenorhabditis auriculariae]|uniref:Uncharacterized protein n=1 Tax=Caenorhabditis auriculariae TaxID=2777116 RepID=A0A8S1HVZ6_9PELO|nr:unnamed protein product [Caenorhabditis auriculariae]